MSVSRTPENLAVVPRNIRFDVTAAKDGHWLGGDPVGAHSIHEQALSKRKSQRHGVEHGSAHRISAKPVTILRSGNIKADVPGNNGKVFRGTRHAHR
jgi:hypothetical protein